MFRTLAFTRVITLRVPRGRKFLRGTWRRRRERDRRLRSGRGAGRRRHCGRPRRSFRRPDRLGRRQRWRRRRGRLRHRRRALSISPDQRGGRSANGGTTAGVTGAEHRSCHCHVARSSAFGRAAEFLTTAPPTGSGIITASIVIEDDDDAERTEETVRREEEGRNAVYRDRGILQRHAQRIRVHSLVVFDVEG